MAASWLEATPTPQLPVDPATNVLMEWTCRAGVRSRAIWPRRDPAPPPDPHQLAREVVAQLPIPEPTISIGPNPDRVAVKVPMYLWVSDPGTLTTSDSDRGLTITASTSITSVTWSMGEPELEPGWAPVAHPQRRAPSACHVDATTPSITFTCPGPGMPHPPGTAADVGYAYLYHWRSLPERTDGTGAWTVTARVTWTVTWTASTGESGTDTITRTTSTPVRVREWHAVLVHGG